MKKMRLDNYLAEKNLADSRSLAQRLIMAGKVEVNGQLVIKPSHKIGPEDVINLREGPKFVSRGGEKLEPALEQFGHWELYGKTCVDVGSSTGGFTDCLLQHNAERVYAVDVGYGILHWKLRNDPRVVVMERTNARTLSGFPEIIDLVTVDASFISLKILLPVIKNWFSEGGEVIALIKPQFEAGRKDAAKGAGVIRSQAIHEQILMDILTFCQEAGFGICGLIQSSLLGPKGNKEFLIHLNYPMKDLKSDEKDLKKIICDLFPEESSDDDDGTNIE